jgi:hypothetical protein
MVGARGMTTLRRARAFAGFVVVILFSAVVSAAVAQQQQQAQAPGSLGVVVDQVLGLFPKVSGEIIEAQGDNVTLSLGKRDGVVAGLELSLYREGRELYHPKTKVLLGHAEQSVGRMVVREVFEAYSTGTVSPGTEVQAGDRARVSAGKIRLTIVPLIEGVKDGLVEAAVHDLIEGFTRTERFQVGMGDGVAVELTGQGLKREEILEGKGLAGVATRFRLDNALVVYFKRVQNKPFMDVRLFSFPAGAQQLTTSMFLPPSLKAPVKGDFSGSGQARPNQTAVPTRSFLSRLLSGDLDAGTYSTGESAIPLKEVAKFPFVVLGLDVAVAPGDKIARLAITDGERVFLYRIVDRVLEAEWTYKPDARGKIFSVQLADVDGDGVLEVVVNRYHPNPGILLNSFVLATRNGKPAALIEDVDQILFAVDADGSADGVKKTLWAQPFEQNGFWKKGSVERVVIRNGRLVSEGRVRVPSSFRATGATMSNIAGKGIRALAFVDENSRMRVALDTEDAWRSATPVGGGLPKLEVMTNIEKGGRSFLYLPEAMPLAVDLDGDGIEEVVVVQNQVPGRLGVIFKGPAGYRFQSVNSGFEGTVTGIGAIPAEGSTPTLVVSVVRYYGMLSSSGETQIIMTTPE